MLYRYAKLYWQFFKLRLKVMMEYRTDFFIGVFSTVLTQGAAVLFIGIVFSHIESIHGWTFYEIMFIYGISMTGRALEYIFFDNLWVIGMNYIRPGNFDRLMIRPINPLFNLIADRVQADGLGQLLTGVTVLLTASSQIGFDWTAGHIIFMLIAVLSSGVIFLSVNLFFATFSFWMTDSIPIMMAVHGLSDFARYPLSIYPRVIQVILTFLIPYGFTAFYPAAFFMNDSSFKTVALWTPAAAAISLFLAYQFWRRGLRAFASTGS
ncbi:ABC transporter permease [Paenibacillus stellifer]|uniref:ABC transporter permease n=1 Tax=Paenibacillus stellifer TaxID=169760 RepID=A0A089LU19_9BACL|nr:ABC-2 family transporter protein [Paenibacillus stellifer]AIQ63620.1 ABC transporter permease [Paenibacillus stellifer]